MLTLCEVEVHRVKIPGEYITWLIDQWWIQDFPDQGEPNPLVLTPKNIFGNIFAKNCRNMKEFWPIGGASLAPPPHWIR